MTKVFEKKTHDWQLALWLIEEALPELEKMAEGFSALEPDYFLISNKQRKREWLAVRLLLNEVLGTWPKIDYLPSGRPILKNNALNISISHTSNMVGVLISKHPNPGIDIENQNRDVSRVIKRFLSENEQKMLSTNASEISVLFWCTKEAVFKAMQQADVNFQHHIAIRCFTENAGEGIISAEFIEEQTKQNIELAYFTNNGNTVVYTTHNNCFDGKTNT